MLTAASADAPRINAEPSAQFTTLSALLGYIGPRWENLSIAEKVGRLRQGDLEDRMRRTIATLEWAERMRYENLAFSRITFDLDVIFANIGRKPIIGFLEPCKDALVQTVSADGTFVFRVTGGAAAEAVTIKDGEAAKTKIRIELAVVDPSVDDNATMSNLEAFRHMHLLSRQIASGAAGGLPSDIPIRVIDFGMRVVLRSKFEKRTTLVRVPVVLYCDERLISDHRDRLDALIAEDVAYTQWMTEHAAEAAAQDRQTGG